MLLQLEENNNSSSFNNDNSCLSKLTKEFVKRVEYAQITKDEALHACRSVLSDLQEEEYVFHSLIENGILIPSSKNIYLINDRSTQSILVKLSPCYSPSCTINNCYTPTCPNKRTVNTMTTLQLIDHTANNSINSKIPLFILEGLSKKERKRQLAIEELHVLEDNFVKQLIVIRDKFAKPLLYSTTLIDESRKIIFHNTLFGNYNVLANYHSKILKELDSARKQHYLYTHSIAIGDILFKYFKKLMEPYIIYVSNHVFSEYLLNLELSRNSNFYDFIQQQQSIEKDFRLTLKGLLLSPIMRITKYQLLFQTMIDNTPLDEQYTLKQSKELLSIISYKMNEATRKAQIEQRLLEIKNGIKFKKNRLLLNDDVSLIYEGKLELMNRIPPITCQVFLFSNSLFITREKINTVDHSIEFNLYDKPIPLHMLKLSIHSTNNHSISSTTTSQPTLLSSIRHQLSNGSYQYIYQQRRWNSENNITASTKIVSDDGSSTYSGVYTLSGLKLRHRIKSIKKRMKKPKSISYTPTTTTNATSPAPRVLKRRILQFHHLADPTLTYLFECPSADERLVWKNKIKSILPDPDEGPFALETLVSNSNYSSLRNVNGRYATGCGTIWCSLPFTTSDGRDVIALGTRLGVWVAYTDGSEIFRHILPYNCHQLELFDNRILLARCSKPNRILGAIYIDHIYPPSSNSSLETVDIMKEFIPLQKSGVISFAVGTLRGESIICYLRRRRTGSVRLVLMSSGGDTPFRKYKEYKPMTMQPKDLIISQDAIYIRSPTEGIEKVDIINWIMGTQNNTFHHVKYSYRISLSNYYPMMSSLVNNNTQTDDPSLTTIGYVPLSHPNQKETAGLICSGKAAYPVVEPNTDVLQQEILFETEAKNIVICYPYLIVFSSNVIEIRHLETTALVQAIGGNKIKCVYVSRPLSNMSPPIIHISMLHVDEDQTKVYQLYLKEPIITDE